MAATFDWERDSGAATGSPAKGTTRTTAITDVNWKAVTTEGTAYSASPITDGQNSVENNIFGKFTSGTFNALSAGLFAHTATAFGTGLTLKGVPACTGDADRYIYTTPSQTANSNLTTNMTSAISIASGVGVCFGSTGPEATGKATTQDGTADRYTNFLTTQLQVSGAAAGDTAQVTLTLQYNEN